MAAGRSAADVARGGNDTSRVRAVVQGDWGQDGVDSDVPNVARMYDYFLGGGRNFPADREAAQRIVGAFPEVPVMARANRAFLKRVVRHLVVDLGVRQLIDLGSGIPASGNVHEVAQEAAPGTRVIYVDIDRTAVLHSRVLLLGNRYASVVQADLRNAEGIVMHRDVRHFVDFQEPVAVLALAVLHFITDDRAAAGALATFYDHAAPGSYCAVTHPARDSRRAQVDRVTAVYRRSGNPVRWRTRDRIEALFGKFELVEPGLVPWHEWRPDEETTDTIPDGVGYGGLAVKPA